MKRSLAPRRRFGLVGLFAAVLLMSAPQLAAALTADDCEDICGGGNDACTVGAVWDIIPGSVIDCSGRDVTVGVDGNLKVTGGSYELYAANLIVNGSGGTITAIQSADGSPGSVHVETTGDFTLSGKLRANGDNGGGSISVVVGGNMAISENGTDGIEALGTSIQGGGGSIDVSVAGSLTVYDPILADSGASGPASGGRIHLKAGGDIWTGSDGHISAYGRQGGGGEIVVSANGDIILYEHLKAEGIGSGADGGSIEVSAGDSLDVAEAISVMGGVNVSGSTANGGTIDLLSGCGGTSIGASIDARGGEGGGTDVDPGDVVIESRGSVTVATGVVIDAHALQSGGSGGNIQIAARDLVDLQGTAKIDARGSTSSQGEGGSVQLSGCRIQVANGATIDTAAAVGGTIALRATKAPPTTNGSQPQPMTIGATSVVRAAGATNADNGRIELSPLHTQPGLCTSSNADCVLDVDCTAGCETGECNYANPDTAGLNSQFDLIPSRQEEADFGECQATCD